MNSDMKKIVAVAGGGLVVLGSFAAGHVLLPRTIVKEVPGPERVVEKEIKVPVEVPVAGPVQIVEKNVTVSVPVDNGNLKMVLDTLVKKDGHVEYLTDGLDDDQTQMIVDRIAMTNEWQDLAFNKTKAKVFDELHKETIGGITLYNSDMRSLYIDYKDITVENTDFEHKDADILVPFSFRQDDNRFEGTARVTILDDSVDDLVVENVTRTR